MASSGEEDQNYSEVDNKYSDEEEEKDENLSPPEEIEMINQKKQYKGSFSTVKEESLACPYQSCGRKFVSADQLKLHVERRHAPNIKKQPEQVK